jgi:AcrR family transcriptional regulator
VSPPSQRGSRDAYHHGDLRQALVDAALEVIDEEDVAAVSLRALARKVGVTYAAPYHHFTDKNALLAAVAQEGFAKLHAVLDEAVAAAAAGGAPPREQFRALGHAHVAFALSHRSHYRVMFGRELKDKECYPDLHGTADSCFGKLMAVSAIACGGAANPAEVMSLAVTAWSAAHGLAMLWIDGPLEQKLEGTSIDGLVDGLIDRLFAGDRSGGWGTGTGTGTGSASRSR